MRKLSVSPCPSYLLKVGLRLRRKIIVNHKARSGLIYAHPESRCSYDQADFISEPGLLYFSALWSRHTGVVWRYRESPASKPLSYLHADTPRTYIDDSCSSKLMKALIKALVFIHIMDDCIVKVRPIRRLLNKHWVFQAHIRQDVLSNSRRSRSCERYPLSLWHVFA
jgi:hypothetical protein